MSPGYRAFREYSTVMEPQRSEEECRRVWDKVGSDLWRNAWEAAALVNGVIEKPYEPPAKIDFLQLNAKMSGR